MLELRMTIVGEQVFARTLQGLEERAEDLRPVWDKLANRFGSAMKRQFSSEGRYGGSGWAPLSPDYAAAKARMWPGQPILVASGGMRAGLTDQPFDVDVREPHMFIVGTMDPKAEWHHKGAGRLPRRPVVQLPETEKRDWVKELQRFYVTGRTS